MAKSERYTKVKDEQDLTRDSETNAVVSSPSSFQKFKEQKRRDKQNEELISMLDSFFNELHEDRRLVIDKLDGIIEQLDITNKRLDTVITIVDEIKG